MAENDIYVGSCKTQTFDNGSEILRGSICLSDIPEEHIFEAQNGKRYLQIDIGKKKDGVDQWGKSHWIKINQYKPKQETETESSNEDIPF